MNSASPRAAGSSSGATGRRRALSPLAKRNAPSSAACPALSGLAPTIMVSLLAATHTSLSVSFYILAMAVISFISVYLITETYEGEMAGDVTKKEGVAASG